jgi:hypothetical protein
MKRTTLLLLTFGFVFPLTAQINKPDCNCPVKRNISGKADTIFTFSNQASIGLCGPHSKNYEVYTDFVLFWCGQTKVISEGSYLHPYEVKMEGDTLVVIQKHDLPIGENLKLKSTPFYIKKYYFNGNTLVDTAYILKDIPKYSTEQIKTVLKQYAGITKNLPATDKVDIANRLILAFASGSKEAENYLITFEKKFGPFDELSGEYFYSIWDTYQLYKNQK